MVGAVSGACLRMAAAAARGDERGRCKSDEPRPAGHVRTLRLRGARGHRGNPSALAAQLGGVPRFARRSEFIASPCHTEQLKGVAMRCSGLVALGFVLVATAVPAAARPPGENGQIAFVRADPLVGRNVYTVNPDGSHEHQLLTDPVDLN